MNTHKYSSTKFGIIVLGSLLLCVSIPGLYPELFPKALALEPPIINCLSVIIGMVSMFLAFTLPRTKNLAPSFDRMLSQSIQKEEAPPIIAKDTTQADKDHQELVQLLAMLQKEGRLLDFVMQDISEFDEKHIAAAARYVHDNCGKFLRENFDIQAVHPSEEGTPITILDDNMNQYEFVNSDSPSKSGILMHRGWKVGNIKFSQKEKTNYSITSLIAPAQVKVTAQTPKT